jgi:hypothetical protein
MGGGTDREAEIQRLKEEIARCKWAMGNISDNQSLEQLGAYLKDLQRALAPHMSGEDPPADRPHTE